MPTHEKQSLEIHYSLRQEMSELFVSMAVKNFALGLVGVFTPIFLYLYFDYSVVKVLLFVLAQYLAHAALSPVAGKLTGRLGVKKMIAFSLPFFGLYYIFLNLAQDYGMQFIYLALVAKIIYVTVFWPARHIDFAFFSSETKKGKQISLANIIISLSRTAAPLVGGMVIVNFGYNVLFAIASILFMLSSIPLLMSRDLKEEYKFNWLTGLKDAFYNIKHKNKHSKGDFLAFFAGGMEGVFAAFVLPIFFFIVLEDYELIGGVTTLSLVLVVVFSYLFGTFSDKKGETNIIHYTTKLHSLSYILIGFIYNPLSYIFLSTYNKIVEAAAMIPFTSLFYRRAKAKGDDIDEYVIYHEILINAGRALMILVMVIGFSLGLTNFMWYFFLAAISAYLKVRYS